MHAHRRTQGMEVALQDVFSDSKGTVSSIKVHTHIQGVVVNETDTLKNTEVFTFYVFTLKYIIFLVAFLLQS